MVQKQLEMIRTNPDQIELGKWVGGLGQSMTQTMSGQTDRARRTRPLARWPEEELRCRNTAAAGKGRKRDGDHVRTDGDLKTSSTAMAEARVVPGDRRWGGADQLSESVEGSALKVLGLSATAALAGHISVQI